LRQCILDVHRSAKPHSFTVHYGESKAKPFSWKAEWVDIITGELQIIDPFTPNATRRWISFETNPISM
jgi:hypothetical protein